MTETARLLSGLGVTREGDIRNALRSFIDEYNVNYRQKNHSHIIRDNILKIGDIIGLMAFGPHIKLSQVLFQNSAAILGKIGRMVVLNESVTEFSVVSDYARIAAHVYGNRKDDILSKNWIHLGNMYHNLKLDDTKSGLQAALYYRLGVTPQYVYAIAGTKGSDIKDWKANAGQLIGRSDQYDRACEIAVKLSRVLGKSRLVMVGHSKGGGQAAYCAMSTGCKAITFNPAGLGLSKYKHMRGNEQKIDSYVMVKDPLNLMQMLAQLISADITADGSVHYLKNDKSSSISEWHGIDGFLRLIGMTDMHRIGE